MVQEDSNCNWCGASITGTDKNCPTCGKPVATKLVGKGYTRIEIAQDGKDYAGVFQQQGRMITDTDWDEMPRITKTRDKIATVQCSSCGSINGAKNTRCKNCGAHL